MSLNLHFRKLGFSFFLARNHRTLGISHGISFRSFKKNGGWHDLQVNPQPAHFHQPWPEVKMQMQQKTKEGWVKFCQPTTKCVCIILQINDKYIYIFVYKCMIICIYIYIIFEDINAKHKKRLHIWSTLRLLWHATCELLRHHVFVGIFVTISPKQRVTVWRDTWTSPRERNNLQYTIYKV